MCIYVERRMKLTDDQTISVSLTNACYRSFILFERVSCIDK